MLLGRQPHHIVSTLLHAVWHRSRRSSTSDGDVEESNQSRNCPSPEGVGSAVLVTTELDGYRTGPRLWPRPRMVLPPASLTVHLACVAGPWTEGRLALAGTGGGSDQGLPRFSSSVAPQFPPQKANRPVGSCGAAPAGWLAGCNCSSQGGRPFCHEMTRPTTHSTTNTIPTSALYVECRPRFRFYYYCTFFSSL